MVEVEEFGRLCQPYLINGGKIHHHALPGVVSYFLQTWLDAAAVHSFTGGMRSNEGFSVVIVIYCKNDFLKLLHFLLNL